MDMLYKTAIVTVLLNTFTGTKAWVSGWTIGPPDYRTFRLSIQNLSIMAAFSWKFQSLSLS